MARPEKIAYELSDAERRDLIGLIQQGKPLPEKYRPSTSALDFSHGHRSRKGRPFYKEANLLDANFIETHRDG